MSEGERPGEPVGTVAEEAARLVASLRGWAGAPDGAARDGDHHAGGGRGWQPAAGSEPGTEAGNRTESGNGAAPDGCDCSCHRAGEAAACRLCPVCRGIALLRSVRPETLERVADVAAMAAAALHDLAEQRRADRPAEDGRPGTENDGTENDGTEDGTGEDGRRSPEEDGS